MAIFSSLMFIPFLILCISSINLRQLENDHMCQIKGGVLCVKDELMILATTAKGIAQTANEIEKNIQETTKISKTLNGYVDREMNYTHNNLPMTYFHRKFFDINNINKDFLNDLFREAHYAMIYYYHSIDDLLNLKGVFGQTTDEWFKKIQNTMKDDIICRYRSILDLYSQKWMSSHDIGRIHFSKKHRLSPSLVHNVYSVVIARYLKEWMDQIIEVIINIELKYF